MLEWSGGVLEWWSGGGAKGVTSGMVRSGLVTDGMIGC